MKLDSASIQSCYFFLKPPFSTVIIVGGEPYFTHPVGVASIIADMKLDSASIITGLLHDTVEDTLATLDVIEEV